MANADDLRKLAEEMASAHEERVQVISATKEAVSAMKQETADLLRDFDKAHDEMARTLRSDLSKIKPDLTSNTIRLLTEFDNAHSEMADRLRDELGKFKSDLDAAGAERKKADQAEIAERKDYIADLREKAQEMLIDFDNAHSEMADRLRDELDKFKSDLDAAEADRKKVGQAEIAERKDYIADLREKAQELVNEFDKAHEEMAKELRDILARVKPDLESAESDRKAVVRAVMAAIQAEIRETAAAWKKLLATMQSARKRAVIRPAKVKAAAKVKPVEAAIEKEEEPESVEREELKEEIIELLEENPDGLKMTQVADNLGIESWRSLIPVMRELLDEGEVRKEDSIYYVA